MSYVDFQAPDELKKKTADFVKNVIDKRGKIKKGLNEVTKCIERGIAKLVVLAEDISPGEIVMHVPKISQEKKVPYVYLATKLDLGKAAGIKVGCAALAVIEIPKEMEVILKEIVSDVAQLKK